MIPIQKKFYTSNEQSEKVFSRLTESVEKVGSLARHLITRESVDTDKTWIGVYNPEKLSFGLMEPNSRFNIINFQIIVRGKIIAQGEKSKINITLKLGWYTFLVYFTIYLATVVQLYYNLIDFKGYYFLGFIVWTILFPVTGTYMLKKKLDKIITRLEGLLGVK